MGVRNLWPLLASTARPINVSTLDGRRIAVDASIWIYHFLKAMRDGSGNALAYSHVVGFFRRICKLMFLGIKPVFVFDGVAPELKRMTIARRRSRREGMRDNARRTAEKLLSVQLQRYANRELTKANTSTLPRPGGAIAARDSLSSLTWQDSQKKTTPTRQKSALSEDIFRRSDPYNLPDLSDPNGEIKVAHDDNRVMTRDEMNEYSELFQPITASESGAIKATDSAAMSIDFDSEEFYSLPLATQYELLNSARSKSRLRMGYTKDQLEQLFPNRLEFSKFQIQRVVQRNFFTEKIMKFSDGSAPNEGWNGPDSSSAENATYNAKRIAGERGGAYVLEKNEKGWTLALKGTRNQDNQDLDTVITLDECGNEVRTKYVNNGEVPDEDEEEDENMDWEDVPLTKKSKVVYNKPNEPFKIDEEENANQQLPESLRSVENVLHRDRIYNQQIKQRGLDEDESEDLQRALAMSLDPVNLKPAPVFRPNQPFIFESDDEEESNETGKLSTRQNESIKIDLQEKGEIPPKVILPPWFIDDNDINEEGVEEAEERYPVNDGIVPADDIDEEILKDEAAGLIRPIRLTEMRKTGLLGDIKHGEKSNHDVIVIPDEENNRYNNSVKLDENNGPEREKLNRFSKIIEVNLVEDAESKSFSEETIHTVQELGEKTSEKAISSDKMLETRVNAIHEPTAPINSSHLVEPITKTLVPLTKEEENLAEADEEFAKMEETEFLKQFEAESEEFLRFTKRVNEDNRASTDKYSKMGLTASSVSMPTDPHQATAKPQQIFHNNTFTSKTEEQMQREIDELLKQQSKEKRDSDEVTEQMTREVQKLLTLFGIPFITAPTEAEAQCAKLIQLSLVDGIITDDSDCFLFGGTKVYKNFFNQNKYVECYQLEDIDRELALDRSRLIEMALVLGSDYTDGLAGVGPVTAMELLAEFRSTAPTTASDQGDQISSRAQELESFKQWFEKYQHGDISQAEAGFRKKFAKQFGEKLFLPKSFPDKTVIGAYWNPVVDEDETRFQWGTIDMDGVREYLMDLIGWERAKIDEVLVPVIREINQRERVGHRRQRGLDEWVVPLGNDSNKASKRLRGAVQRLRK